MTGPTTSRWLARGEHEVPADVETWGSWLSPPEAAYARSLRFTKRRTEFLLRRWTAKHAVVTALGLPPNGGPDESSVEEPAEALMPLRHGPTGLWRVAVLNRPTGAPYVLVDGAPAGVEVSVTDRAGWAVCLVGSDLDAVGVDLELVEPRSEGFVSDFLTGPEAAVVRGLAPGDERDAAANLLWSAKESALKVLRTGLRADTRTVEVTFDPDDLVAASRTSAAPGGPAGWHRLAVRHTVTGQVFPGWWRRDGAFVLTTAGVSLAQPPALLSTSSDLTSARPIHSWLTAPVVP